MVSTERGQKSRQADRGCLRRAANFSLRIFLTVHIFTSTVGISRRSSRLFPLEWVVESRFRFVKRFAKIGCRRAYQLTVVVWADLQASRSEDMKMIGDCHRRLLRALAVSSVELIHERIQNTFSASSCVKCIFTATPLQHFC